MAYVIVIGEGEQVEAAMQSTASAKGKRVRVLTSANGVRVLYDTNEAREFVRDVKRSLSSGKLYVFRCDDPQEVFEAGDGGAA